MSKGPSRLPFRILPRVDDTNRHYWTGGADGELRILRCDDDGTWIHPPAPICPTCLGRSLTPADHVGSRRAAHLHGEPPAVVPGARAALRGRHRRAARTGGPAHHRRARRRRPRTTSRIGMPMRVTFEQYDDVWLPFFEPEPRAAADGPPAARRRRLGHRPVRHRSAAGPGAARPHRSTPASRRSPTPGSRPPTSTASPPTPGRWTCRRGSAASASPRSRTPCG